MIDVTSREAGHAVAVAEREARALALRKLIADGLTFADAMQEFAKDNGTEERAYVKRAQYKHIHDEGEIEVDDNAIVSLSDTGAYVMAWTWVQGSDEDEAPE